MSALGTRQILCMDQGHLTTIGQPPESLAQGIAVLGEPSVNDSQDLLAWTHWRARRIRDEDCHELAGYRAIAPNMEESIRDAGYPRMGGLQCRFLRPEMLQNCGSISHTRTSWHRTDWPASIIISAGRSRTLRSQGFQP